MTTLQTPRATQPLVDKDGKPTQTTQRLIDELTRRINAVALLTDPVTAEQIRNALKGET